ncbi:MAG: hypothetical protein AVDCRST_MAG13-1233, partial [uncultured Solirubrobacteraceae bacterium]
GRYAPGPAGVPPEPPRGGQGAEHGQMAARRPRGLLRHLHHHRLPHGRAGVRDPRRDPHRPRARVRRGHAGAVQAHRAQARVAGGRALRRGRGHPLGAPHPGRRDRAGRHARGPRRDHPARPAARPPGPPGRRGAGRPPGRRHPGQRRGRGGRRRGSQRAGPAGRPAERL